LITGIGLATERPDLVQPFFFQPGRELVLVVVPVVAMDRDLPADFAAGIVGAFQTKLNVDEQGRRVVSATGSYTATAPLFQDGGFIMQMVAFRAATN